MRQHCNVNRSYRQSPPTDHSLQRDATPVLAENDDCSQEYWSLIENTQEKDFPKFVQAMRLQDDTQRERGRSMVFEFGDVTNATSFGSSEELKTYLDKKAKECSTDEGFRSLFFLENLGRNYVEILGSRLSIPPSFFRAHWTDPESIIDQYSLSQPYPEYHRLKYPQLHRLILSAENEDYQLGPYSDPKSDLERYLLLPDKGRNFEMSTHQVSCWSRMKSTCRETLSISESRFYTTTSVKKRNSCSAS